MAWPGCDPDTSAVPATPITVTLASPCRVAPAPFPRFQECMEGSLLPGPLKCISELNPEWLPHLAYMKVAASGETGTRLYGLLGCLVPGTWIIRFFLLGLLFVS